MEHNKKSMLDMDVHTTKAAQSTIKCTNSTSSNNPIIIKCTNSNNPIIIKCIKCTIKCTHKNQIINKCINRIIKCTNRINKCTNKNHIINRCTNRIIKCTNSNNQIINKCTNRIIKCTNLTKHYRTGSRCNRTSNPRCIGSKSTCRVKSCLRMKTCRPCRPPRLKTM